MAQLTPGPMAVPMPGVRGLSPPPEACRCRMPPRLAMFLQMGGGRCWSLIENMSVFIHRIGPKPAYSNFCSGGGAAAGPS